MLAIISRQQLLGAQILQFDAVALRQTMLPADDKPEILRKERPGVEPVPLLTDLRGNAEFCLAFLQHLGDLAAVAAQKLELQPLELPLDLVGKRNEQRDGGGRRELYPERAE